MSHLRDVVKPHVGDSVGFLVAQAEPCITIASDERRAASGRRLEVVAPEDLDDLELPVSWVMAVLLCPGEDTAAVAVWAGKQSADVRRVHFYLHADTEIRPALRAWHDAGLPIHSTWTVRRWNDLHPHLGSRWNQQIHDDFCSDDRCPLA